MYTVTRLSQNLMSIIMLSIMSQASAQTWHFEILSNQRKTKTSSGLRLTCRQGKYSKTQKILFSLWIELKLGPIWVNVWLVNQGFRMANFSIRTVVANQRKFCGGMLYIAMRRKGRKSDSSWKHTSRQKVYLLAKYSCWNGRYQQIERSMDRKEADTSTVT